MKHERVSKFLLKRFTSDNNVEYIPDEIALARYSLRSVKLLTEKELFGGGEK